ncbi:pilus assembly protein [Pusillimonas sp. SM2304]|uniref:pilus assembly protein n=1 Tax=Pusillimonas sp. SM2304 TaxID=3073241 RepID=UPI002876BCC1|nr:pilus assembly protein [Pusillimonas sp. SM2304]MDS1138917.1 pilus assembly protein [Pusillimonas sp. SM2304]
MLRTIFLALFYAIAVMLPPAHAEGELMVMPSSLKVYNNHDHSVKVRNMGDAPLYLSISVQKVMNPGVEPEVKVPMGQVDRPGMLASPDKITLGPGQSRAVSLKSLYAPDAEELYRVYIVPVRSLQVREAPEDRITAPMSVSVGYGVLVRHMPPPAKQRSAWTHRCTPGGVLLENTGNVRLLFSDVTAAGGAKKNWMALFPGTPQLFPGKSLSLSADDKRLTLDCR